MMLLLLMRLVVLLLLARINCIGCRPAGVLWQ